MKVEFQSVGFKADQKLLDFTKSKLSKLDQFSDKLIGAEVYFKVVNTQDEENKEAEIKILVPGNDMFAKKHGKSFEEAVDLAVEALRRQVRKSKGKEQDNKK